MLRCLPRRYFVVLLLLIAGWQLWLAFYIESKAFVAQILLHQAWDETSMVGDRVHPWPWADTWPVARLKVARLGVDQIVLAGTSGRTLAFGPGHLSGSTLPGGDGNAVLSGHRDTHFEFLQALRTGDKILLVMPDRREISYSVYRTSVFDQSDRSLLLADREELTLITCYPFDAVVPGGPLRYLVLARPDNTLARVNYGINQNV